VKVATVGYVLAKRDWVFTGMPWVRNPTTVTVTVTLNRHRYKTV